MHTLSHLSQGPEPSPERVAPARRNAHPPRAREQGGKGGSRGAAEARRTHNRQLPLSTEVFGSSGLQFLAVLVLLSWFFPQQHGKCIYLYLSGEEETRPAHVRLLRSGLKSKQTCLHQEAPRPHLRVCGDLRRETTRENTLSGVGRSLFLAPSSSVGASHGDECKGRSACP